MKMKNRVLSFFLAVLMFASVFTAFPPLEMWAASGTIPKAVSMSPIDGYSTTEVTLRGKITANGGSEIKRYGFQYGIVGGSKSETKEWSGHLTTGKEVEFELTGLQPNTTIWYYFYAVNSTGTAKDASDRDEEVNGTQYASTLPEIEIEVSKDELNFDADGGDLYFNVEATSSFTVSDNQSWISVSPTSGSSDTRIKVTCKANTTPYDREGTVTVTDKSTGTEHLIAIYQEAAEIKAEFDFSKFKYSEEIVLGDDLTWEGYVYIDNGTFDTVTISIKNPNGDSIYYRQTNVNDDVFDTEDILDGSISTGKNAPSGQKQDSSGNWYTYNNFSMNLVGTYKLYVTASAKGTGEYDKQEYTFNVIEPDDPEILKITASSSSVRVGEDIVFTVTTNSSVKGIAFFVDANYNHIGSIENTNGKVTHSFTFRFNKTGKEDSNGNDTAIKRTIYAYPIDEDGEAMLDAGLVYCSVTVNPAKYNFDNFNLNNAQTIIGTAVTITWEAVTSKNGSTVYYNLWIDNELVAEDLTENSYTLTAAQVKKFGVGEYGTMVMATAYQHRQKQAKSGLYIYPEGYVIVYPGDVNGDGTIDATDVTKLKKYLANYDETDPKKQTAVNSVGADVNGDGKINGKDLNALYVKLENGNIELPKPEPEPDISTLPAVKHTYTVKIPLDKANLKATTGRTIYLMPLNGYFALVAQDETGKEVSLEQAGITWEFSKPEMFQFGGHTLTAKACGLGYIKLTQKVNGEIITTQYTIHIGEASTLSSNWPSPYQYAKDDYEYVSMCLDLTLSIHKANMPTDYADVDLNMSDIVIDSCANVTDYLNWIFQGEFDMSVNTMKKSLSSFVVDYAKFINSDDLVMKKASGFSVAFSDFIKAIKDDVPALKDLCVVLGVDFDVLSKAIKMLNENKSISDNELKTLLLFIKRAEQDQVIGCIPSIMDYINGLKELGFTWEAFSMTCGKAYFFIGQELGQKIIKLSKDKLFWAGLTLDAVESIMFFAADYTESIKVLELMRSYLINFYDTNSDEIKAIDELIVDFKYDYFTAYKDLEADVSVALLMSMGHPIVSVGSFAAKVASELLGIDEKRDISILTFYVCAFNKTLNSYMDMYNYGKITSSLSDLKFCTSMYLNLIYRQNVLAKSIAKDQGKEAEIDIEIKEIERIFVTYLKY